ERVRRIREAISHLRTNGGPITHTMGDDRRAFLQELRLHASGHMAPLVSQLDVGWPAQFLEGGLVLTDLPGVGIANDAYRSITSHFVRSARAIMVVVDKSGLTEASAELLRT